MGAFFKEQRIGFERKKGLRKGRRICLLHYLLISQAYSRAEHALIRATGGERGRLQEKTARRIYEKSVNFLRGWYGTCNTYEMILKTCLRVNCPESRTCSVCSKKKILHAKEMVM